MMMSFFGLLLFLALFTLALSNIELRKNNHDLRTDNHKLFMQNTRLNWDIEVTQQELRMTEAEYGVKHLHKNKVRHGVNHVVKVERSSNY